MPCHAKSGDLVHVLMHYIEDFPKFVVWSLYVYVYNSLRVVYVGVDLIGT